MNVADIDFSKLEKRICQEQQIQTLDEVCLKLFGQPSNKCTEEQRKGAKSIAYAESYGTIKR